MTKVRSRLKKVRIIRNGVRTVRRFFRYLDVLSEFLRFRSLASARPELPVKWKNRYLCLDDKTQTTGFDRHYVFHTAWAARIVADTRPARHVDISSSLFFCGIVSAFVPVDFYDFRPAQLDLTNLESRPGDLMQLPFADSSIASLSCMHVIEHIGLGRYGDPLDPWGDVKAINQLKRVIAPGGTLIFVVPVGRPSVMFNAHRVYGYRQVIDHFAEFTLHEFALVPDRKEDGGLIRNAEPALVASQNYACGCFWFVRSPAPNPIGDEE